MLLKVYKLVWMRFCWSRREEVQCEHNVCCWENLEVGNNAMSKMEANESSRTRNAQYDPKNPFVECVSDGRRSECHLSYSFSPLLGLTSFCAVLVTQQLQWLPRNNEGNPDEALKVWSTQIMSNGPTLIIVGFLYFGVFFCWKKVITNYLYQS